VAFKNIKTGTLTNAGRLSVNTITSLIIKIMNHDWQVEYSSSRSPVKRSTKKSESAELDVLMSGLALLVPKTHKIECIPLEILTRNTDSPPTYVDVGYLQALASNKRAIFQVASNFNGIEAIKEDLDPDYESFTERYWLDPTQGPAASISTGAAAIARVHCAYVGTYKDINAWCQTGKRQLNFMDNLKEHFPQLNGYVILSGQESKFPRIESREYYKLLLLAKACYHKNCQVTTGCKTSKGLEKVHDPKQLVDQCLCAAINISQGDSGKANSNMPDIESKCRFALDLAYNGIYLEALVNRRSQIYLSLVGGGSFGNKKEWIYSSIINAHKKWAIKVNKSPLMKVSLVMWSPRDVGQLVDALTRAGLPHTVIYN